MARKECRGASYILTAVFQNGAILHLWLYLCYVTDLVYQIQYVIGGPATMPVHTILLALFLKDSQFYNVCVRCEEHKGAVKHQGEVITSYFLIALLINSGFSMVTGRFSVARLATIFLLAMMPYRQLGIPSSRPAPSPRTSHLGGYDL